MEASNTTAALSSEAQWVASHQRLTILEGAMIFFALLLLVAGLFVLVVLLFFEHDGLFGDCVARSPVLSAIRRALRCRARCCCGAQGAAGDAIDDLSLHDLEVGDVEADDNDSVEPGGALDVTGAGADAEVSGVGGGAGVGNE
jgi:hypothetical protein